MLLGIGDIIRNPIGCLCSRQIHEVQQLTESNCLRCDLRLLVLTGCVTSRWLGFSQNSVLRSRRRTPTRRPWSSCKHPVLDLHAMDLLTRSGHSVEKIRSSSLEHDKIQLPNFHEYIETTHLHNLHFQLRPGSTVVFHLALFPFYETLSRHRIYCSRWVKADTLCF